MIGPSVDPIFLRKEPLRSSLPIDILIDMETRSLQDIVMRSLSGEERSLLSSTLTEIQEQYNNADVSRSSNERDVTTMVSRFPTWAALVLSGKTVEELRKDYQDGRQKGAGLFCIRFDRFGPSKTPESRARMGVLMVQAASFLKNGSIASIVPERYGGSVGEMGLPEPVRLEMLRTLASQGFLWVEVEDLIPSDWMIDIIQMAKRSGSKVMLSTKVGPGSPLTLSNQDLLEVCDGLKVYIDMDAPEMIRTLQQVLGTFTEMNGDRPLMLSPYGRYSSLARMFLSERGDTRVLLDANTSKEFPGSLMVQDDILRYWSLTGAVGDEGNGPEPLSRNALTGSTGLFFHIGGPGTTNYKLGMLNTAFAHLGEDDLMLPWEARPEDLNVTLGLIREVGAKGALVETPLRTGTLSSMDWVDPRSRMVGAIDIIVGKGRSLYGYNTELYAISDLIKKGGLKKGMKSLVLGTGTTGRAAAVGSSMMGLETVIVGSNLERTRALAGSLGEGVKGVTPKALKRPTLTFDVIIDTVPLHQLNDGGAKEGSDMVEIIKNLRPSLGLDTTVLRGWSPFLAAVESGGGATVKGSDVVVRSAIRMLTIWLDKQYEGSDVQSVLERRIP